MIVDDDRTTVNLLSVLLEMDGFEVVTVPDGGMAVSQAPVVRPDVFLVDYNLSDVIGTECVRMIRSLEGFGTTPIIVSSGLSRESEALASGADFFLEKPFDPQVLVTKLKEMLGLA